MEGRILELMNSTHEDPDSLISKFIQTLILDGFIESFNQSCLKIVAGSGPQNFVCLVNFTGQMEARQCRVLKHGQGFLIVNHKINYLY